MVLEEWVRCGDYNFAVTSFSCAADSTSGGSPASAYSIRIGPWNDCKPAARAVRMAVFVVEQNIPVEIEWDEWDETSLHAVAFDADSAPIGTGRLLPSHFDSTAPATGHIGRMAVLVSARRFGVGGAILQALMQAAPAQGFTTIVLHAQSYVAPFYARHGYVIEGEEFTEAGILHRTMRAPLTPARRVDPADPAGSSA